MQGEQVAANVSGACVVTRTAASAPAVVAPVVAVTEATETAEATVTAEVTPAANTKDEVTLAPETGTTPPPEAASFQIDSPAELRESEVRSSQGDQEPPQTEYQPRDDAESADGNTGKALHHTTCPNADVELQDPAATLVTNI